MMIFYGLLSEELTFQLLSFHLFALGLILSLCSKKLTEGELDDSIFWAFIFSGLCTLLGAYYLWNGLMVGEEAWQLRKDNENYALEIFTAASAAITNFTCVLYFPKDRPRIFQLARYPMAAMALYIILFGGKRTPVLVVLAIVLLFLAKQGRANRIKAFASSFVAILALVFLYVGNDLFQGKVDETAYNIFYGIQNILGNVEVSDQTGSAAARYNSRNWAYSYISENFNVFNYVFGAGYMTRWLDNPVLQAYLDMGVLGFFGYVAIVLLYPARVALKENLSNAGMFSLSLCVHGVLSCINSGTPYAIVKYVPIIILSCFISSGASRRRQPRPGRSGSAEAFRNYSPAARTEVPGTFSRSRPLSIE